MIETIPVPGIDEYDSIYWENCKKGKIYRFNIVVIVMSRGSHQDICVQNVNL